MPKSRPPYPAEFRQQIVELARAGRSPAELSREFGCSAQTITNWIGQAAIDQGKPLPGKEGLTTAEREELARLRRQVRQLQMERDIRQANPRSQPRSMFQTILSCFPPPILDNGSSIYCSTAFQT
jgi:transposase